MLVCLGGSASTVGLEGASQQPVFEATPALHRVDARLEIVGRRLQLGFHAGEVRAMILSAYALQSFFRIVQYNRKDSIHPGK